MRVILAGPDEGELTGAAYPAFAVAGVEVAAVATTPEELADLAAALPDAVAVVQADLYATAGEAAEGLRGLPCRVAVVLPRWWEGERERFAALPNLLAGCTAPVPWAEVAAEVKARAGAPKTETRIETAEAAAEDRLHANTPTPRPTERLRANTRPSGAGRLAALWSGPAGGVGKTSLALLLAAYAAERGTDPLLLALAEPAVSAYLALPRVPNVTAFLEGGNLTRAVQVVRWEKDGKPVSLRVALGPARPRDGVVDREGVAALVQEAQAASPLVIADLPALPPGGNVWSLEPLLHAGSVVLAAAPTAAGVAAVVEALATLRDIRVHARVILAVNRRSASGISLREFIEGVRSLWGDCPPAVEIPYTPGLAAAMERGELPEEEALDEAVAELAEVALGIPQPRPEREREGVETGPERTARPRRLGRLISVEVVD